MRRSVLLVGDRNPNSPNPRAALLPTPPNSAGARLCRRIMGLGAAEYLRWFDRTNVEDGGQVRAKQILQRRGPGGTYVLLGEKAAKAFLGYYEPFSATHDHEDKCGRLFVTLPHPSGRCRTWNDPANAERARDLLRQAGVFPRRVVCGVVVHEGRWLCCQRRGGPLDGRWQTPGGKVEDKDYRGDPTATDHAALARELHEELRLRVRVVRFLGRALVEPSLSSRVEAFHYLCALAEPAADSLAELDECGRLNLHPEHHGWKWLPVGEWPAAPIMPADEALRKRCERYGYQRGQVNQSVGNIANVGAGAVVPLRMRAGTPLEKLDLVHTSGAGWEAFEATEMRILRHVLMFYLGQDMTSIPDCADNARTNYTHRWREIPL